MTALSMQQGLVSPTAREKPSCLFWCGLAWREDSTPPLSQTANGWDSSSKRPVWPKVYLACQLAHLALSDCFCPCCVLSNHVMDLILLRSTTCAGVAGWGLPLCSSRRTSGHLVLLQRLLQCSSCRCSEAKPFRPDPCTAWLLFCFYILSVSQ